MRVCLDIQAGVAQRAGVGRYTRMLAEHLPALAGADEISFFYFDFRGQGIPLQVPRDRQRALRWCPGRVVQAAWKALRWPPFDWLAGRADLYHFPNFVLPPVRSGKTVVTVHDASFVRYPEFAEARNLRYLAARIHDTLRRADAVITDSEFSGAELRDLLHAASEKVFPIHPGIASDLTRAPDEAVRRLRAEFGLDRPYLLTVGTLEPRKNLPFLVTVFEALSAYDGDLVIAGMPGWKYEPILARMKASPRAARIRYIQYVPDEALPALYTGAELFVFPSLYEGFGFPPLEAMACGTPVVSSTGGSLSEALGDAALMVGEFAPEAWTHSVTRALTDSELRARLVEAGRRRAAAYTWAETARRTWDVYRKVAG